MPVAKPILTSGPVVLLFDGHFSHISLNLITISRENNIHLMLLPSNTTHVLQPLDVGVYGPVKQAWKAILGKYNRSTRAANIGKEDIPKLVSELWDTSFKPQHLQGGFRETGLFPVDKKAIPSWKVAPSLPLQPHDESRPVPQLAETPLRSELRKCFIDAIRPTEVKRKPRRERVGVMHYGEAITSDEAVERLKEAEEKKRLAEEKKRLAKKGKKQASRAKVIAKKGAAAAIIEDEDHCQECGEEFEEGEEEMCLGCDKCWRWVHCYCAGLDTTPEEDTAWFCSKCDS